MAHHHSPKIVHDGLVFLVDAINTKSYNSGSAPNDAVNLVDTSQTGSLKNGVGYTNGAWDFDGTDDYILIPNSDAINTVVVTVSMWIKFNTIGIDKVLLSKGTSSNRKYWFYESFGVEFWYRNNRTSAIPPATLLDGNWHNIVGTYDGSSTLSLYHNGVLFNTAGCIDTTTTTENLAINAYPNGANTAGSKQISNVKIYNRALTSQEVLTNFNAHRSRYGI